MGVQAGSQRGAGGNDSAVDERLSSTRNPGDGVRLFLALWPSPAARRALAAWRGACPWGGHARLVPDERLHLTLHFLGQVPRTRLPELRALPVPARRVDLTLDTLALWRQGVAVLQPSVVPSALQDLHGALGRALAALDLPVDVRPWRPHVTLARGADAPAGEPSLVQLSPVRWRTAGHVLVESLPDGGGYVVRRRWQPVARSLDGPRAAP